MPHSIFVACPAPTDATSFYRGLGPLSALQRKFPELVSLSPIGSSVDWFDLTKHSIAFVQRPFTKEHMHVCQMAKSYKVPLWVDYDDDMFNIPLSNQAFPIFGNPRTQAIVLECLKIADVITVSTEHLKRIFQERLPADCRLKVRVINNAWPDIFFGETPRPLNHGKKAFFWRGSATHNEDLEFHLDSFGLLHKQFPDWEFHFLGEPYYKVEQVIDKSRIRVMGPVHTTAYFSLIKTLDVGIALVPLAENTFNRSKSNIAAMEAIFGGAVAVAPSWEEWNGIGSGMYENDLTGFSLANAAMMAIECWKQKAEEQRHLLHSKYLLSSVNQARIELIYDLLG